MGRIRACVHVTCWAGRVLHKKVVEYPTLCAKQVIRALSAYYLLGVCILWRQLGTWAQQEG